MKLKRLLFGTATASLPVDFGLLVLRLGFGVPIALAHGLPKLNRFAERSGSFSDPLGIGSEASMTLAILTEFGCGILLALGLGTRMAALGLMVTMTIIFFIHHGEDPFRERELAFTYLGAWLTLFFAGPGRFSLDRVITRG